MPSMELTPLKNKPVFKKLDGSLNRVMNQELISLKETHDLSDYADFAEIWEKIINLEPRPTIFQLCAVASSNFDAGFHETDTPVRFKNFTESAKYREEQLNAIKNTGQSPEAEDYGSIADAYFWVGKSATDPGVKLESFKKSAEYYEEQLNAIKIEGESPTAIDYNNIAATYLRVGKSATDPGVKLESFKKSAEYYEEQIKTLKNAGQSPTAIDYGCIAGIYFRVGESATNPNVKLASYTTAKSYCEISLKEKLPEDVAQKLRNYLTQIGRYLDNNGKAASHKNLD